jgi:polar amino acid transport system substrate-binding protein
MFPEVRLVKSFKSTMTGSLGIGTRKSDSELMSKINAALEKMDKNGTSKQIIAKWGLD